MDTSVGGGRIANSHLQRFLLDEIESFNRPSHHRPSSGWFHRTLEIPQSNTRAISRVHVACVGPTHHLTDLSVCFLGGEIQPERLEYFAWRDDVSGVSILTHWWSALH